MLVVLSTTVMLMDLFVAIMQLSVSVAVMQLEISATFMQVEVSAANMWVAIFIEILHVGVSVAIMQVVFCTVHYAHVDFYSNYAGDRFCCSYVCDSFYLIAIFHKIDQKTSEGIRHYIKFAFHCFSKYSSKIKILFG